MVRNSIVLGVVAALLLGYILIFERGSISSGELEQRKGSVLPQLVKDRVSRLEIQRAGVTTVLTRGPDEEHGLDLGLWKVEEPYAARADEEAVQTLLGELEWMDARRRLEGLTTDDRAKFGFDKPRFRVWFSVGKERLPVVVGGESPRGDGVYLLTPDPSVAYVVGKDLPEALDQAPEHYHTKELHDGVMLYNLRRLRIADASGERVVEQRDDGHWLTAPFTAMASHAAVEEVVDALDGLRASRFVRMQVGDLAGVGLDRPHLDLRLDNEHKKQGGEGDAGKGPTELATTRLRVGGACADHEDERYALMGEGKDGPLMCVRDADLEKLMPEVDALRERRLLPWPDGRVEKVSVARGKRKLLVERDGDDWRYALEGPGASEGKAHTEAVTEWLAALRAQTAAAFHPTDLAASPRVDVRFVASNDKPDYRFQLLETADGRVLARRGDEPALLELDAGALALVGPTAARYRSPQLLSLDDGGMRALEVVRGGLTEKLEWKGSEPRVLAPVQAAADRVRVGELSRLLSKLEAVRFVADRAEPGHGLDGGLQVRFDHGEQRHTLRIGAETTAGRFARLDDDPAVFVIATRLYSQLERPLASQNLLSTPLEQIASASVKWAEGSLEVVREGEGFALAAGDDTARARRVADALATARALRVTGYGPAPVDHGLANPSLTVSVTTTDGKSHRVLFGAATEDGSLNARRDDLEVGFLVPPTLASALRGEPPAR